MNGILNFQKVSLMAYLILFNDLVLFECVIYEYNMQKLTDGGYYVRVACSTNQLKNLGELPLTVAHLNKINGTPFSRMKELAKLKLQPARIFALLLDPRRWWQQLQTWSHWCLSV